ncbi:hypothetical protein V8C44DRAFT_352186 [Trichoderma aethiopicum]
MYGHNIMKNPARDATIQSNLIQTPGTRILTPNTIITPTNHIITVLLYSTQRTWSNGAYQLRHQNPQALAPILDRTERLDKESWQGSQEAKTTHVPWEKWPKCDAQMHACTSSCTGQQYVMFV